MHVKVEAVADIKESAGEQTDDRRSRDWYDEEATGVDCGRDNALCGSMEDTDEYSFSGVLE